MLEPFDINKGSNFAWQDYIKDPAYALKKNRPIQLVQMTPDQYIEEVAKGFSAYGKKVTPQDLINQRTNDNMRNIMKAMEAGDKFPTPFIEYPKGQSISQEGLHRAVAAKNLGIEKMPVYLQQRGPEYGDTTEAVRKLAKRAYKFGPIVNKLFALPLNELSTGADYLPALDLIMTKDKAQYNKKLQKMFKEAGIDYNNGQFQL